MTMSIDIRCQNLVKTYEGKTPVHAVRGIDLEIPTGECFGLLGPNGAGKTTTVEILEGIRTKTEGTVEILGMNWQDDPMAIREAIGISLQETEFSEKLSIYEILCLFSSFYSNGMSPEQAIAKVGLQEKKDTWVKNLSGGQKQRLAVASGIIGNPQVLFLDEPTTGLDPTSRRQLWDIIQAFKKEKRTVLLTTHYMEEAEILCDRVAIVDQGKIIQEGTPRELIAGLGGESVIEFSVAGGEHDEVKSTLESMPVVSDIWFEKGHYVLRGNDVDSLLPALTSTLQKLDIRLTHLSTRDLGLEDVFISLTGRTIDEETPVEDPAETVESESS